MNHHTLRPHPRRQPAWRSVSGAAIVWLGLALTVSAQSWQTILPSPGFSQEGLPYGRSLLVEPSAPAGGPPGLYLGVVDYSGSPTVFRLRPDDPGFTPAQIVGVDDRMPFPCRMLPVPGQGIHAVGRIAVKVKRDTKYYWMVRRSPNGDPGTWSDSWAQRMAPLSDGNGNLFGSSGWSAIAADIAADGSGSVFVTGDVTDWVEDGIAYPGTRLFLRRLPLTP